VKRKITPRWENSLTKEDMLASWETKEDVLASTKYWRK